MGKLKTFGNFILWMVLISAMVATQATAIDTEADIKKYSINLIWINRTLPSADQKFICSAESDQAFSNKLLTPIIKWARANPQATVNLWYDSVFTPIGCVERTKAVLDNELKADSSASASSSGPLKEPSDLVKVNLCNVRGISIVSDNACIFSEALPVYFRIDLLKYIIVVDAIEHGGDDCAIFADLEVGDLRQDHGRMSKIELFNTEIVNRLNTYPILFNYDNGKDENQFLQLYKDKRMLTTIKTDLINRCFKDAVDALNSKNDWRHPSSRLSEDVFEYHCMLYSNHSWNLTNTYHVDPKTKIAFERGLNNIARRDMDTRHGNAHTDESAYEQLQKVQLPPLKAGEAAYSFRRWE